MKNFALGVLGGLGVATLGWAALPPTSIGGIRDENVINSMYDEYVVERRRMKSHIYALMEYLKVHPEKEWVNDPSVLPPEHPKICKLKIVKNKKP